MKPKFMMDTIGNTPMVKLQRLLKTNNGSEVWAKLEGNNPAGSVKDRPALNMILQAQKRNEIKPGDTLIEATSGNTGIALAMVAATLNYRLKLIMPENMTIERRVAMSAYGAEIILVPTIEGMEGARDLAHKMQKNGEGKILDQFSNPDNPQSHYLTTAPEIWNDTEGKITHFVSAMGTTGTIMGVSKYLKEQNSNVKVIGVQPTQDSSIPGIRRWSPEYLPSIYENSRVDEIIDISQKNAENMTKELAKVEGIFSGVSSGGAIHVALNIAKKFKNSMVITIICDRGDRYISSGIF